jgi:hypothetical protein
MNFMLYFDVFGYLFGSRFDKFWIPFSQILPLSNARKNSIVEAENIDKTTKEPSTTDGTPATQRTCHLEKGFPRRYPLKVR